MLAQSKTVSAHTACSNLEWVAVDCSRWALTRAYGKNTKMNKKEALMITHTHNYERRELIVQNVIFYWDDKNYIVVALIYGTSHNSLWYKLHTKATN
jgi:hypothetical protein